MRENSKKYLFLSNLPSYAGKTLEEISSALGLSIGTIQSYVHEFGGPSLIGFSKGRLEVDANYLKEIAEGDIEPIHLTDHLAITTESGLQQRKAREEQFIGRFRTETAESLPKPNPGRERNIEIIGKIDGWERRQDAQARDEILRDIENGISIRGERLC